MQIQIKIRDLTAKLIFPQKDSLVQQMLADLTHDLHMQLRKPVHRVTFVLGGRGDHEFENP